MLGTLQVSVDRDFARFGSKSYAINKINSVDVRRHYPHGQGGMFVCGLIFLIGAIGLLTDISAGTFAGATVVYAVLAGLGGFTAYRLWLKSKTIEYQLFLTTSSREAQAIASLDEGYIQQLRAQIEAAIAGQAS